MNGYECDLCGACCKTFPIFASEEDARREPRIERESKRLADHLAAPTWRFQLYPLPFLEQCCFLDAEKKCDIYASRPDTCRTFAAGDAQCQEARRRQGLSPLPPSPTPKVS